jgi:GTP pyrophosphokinase
MPTFTDTERTQALDIIDALRHKIGTALLPNDEEKLRRILFRNHAAQEVSRDTFAINPIITALKTATLAVEEIGLRRDGLIATILSPFILNHLLSLEEVEETFGTPPRNILHGLLRVQELYSRTPVIESDNFRNLLLSFAEDMRVILIMIANRVVIMREIRDVTNLEAQRRVAEEASYLYAPLAHKLGLYKLKSELEDLSLKYLDHDAYYHIKEKLSTTKRARDKYIADFIDPVRQRLEAAGLRFHIKGRTKSIHSIWQKMQKQRCPFEGVYDLFAIRIILDSPEDREKMECWQAYSIVTDMYQPNPKRLRDWLSVPKSNGYESLHITVLGPEQKWVEVQIRTSRMDEIAEHGLAAHWRYKGIRAGGGMDEWLAAIRSALEAGEGSAADSREMMDHLRMDMYEDEVFVFTPKGEIRKFPLGATVLDFAYQIHSRIGNQCIGARINGRNVQIRERLHSGDTIEITTSSQQHPKRDWLDIVKTSHARNKIRKALNDMEKEEETYVSSKNVNDGQHPQPPSVLRGAENGNDNGTGAHSAADYVLQTDRLPRPSGLGDDDVLVIDRNLKGIDYNLARCCNPIYGDDIFGFVTVSGGIKIHRTTCPNATQLRQRFGYRIVKARWSGKGSAQYDLTLQVIGNDDISIVNNITSLITKEGDLSLRSINIDTGDGLFKADITVRLGDTTHMQTLIKKLRGVKGVRAVSRK